MNAEYTPKKSGRYSAIKTRFLVADLVLTVVSLAVFYVFLSRPVSRIAFSVSANYYLACLVYSVVFLFFMYFAGFSLHFANSFFVERRFGLTDRTFFSWLEDEVKSLVLTFVLWIACIQVFYLVLRNFPDTWWVITAVIWIFFSIVLARFLPVLLIPVFFKYLPIEDQALKGRIMEMADKAGIRLIDVCQIDFSRKTKKANAALVGLGKTRKVILADTLMKEFTPEEVETVVAHEFGHFKHKHVWQLLAFSAGLTLAGLYILSLAAEKVVALTGASGISDLYLLPVLMLLMGIFGMMVLPVQNLVSRILERQADKFALDFAGSADTFVSVMMKLASMNLAEMDPSRLKKVFLYDHPPIGERIRMAQKTGDTSGGE